MAGFGSIPDNKTKKNVLLILENMCPNRISIQDPRFNDLVDLIVLKTFTFTNTRTHFPIVVTSSDSKFWNKDLHSISRIPLNQHAAIELARSFIFNFN